MRREDLVYRYVLELDDKASGPWNRSAQVQAAAIAQVEEGLDRQTRAAIKHASVTTNVTGREAAAYKEVAAAARRHDAEITRAALNSSATVSRAAVREVEALRKKGITYRQIATDHRRAGISAQQSAAMIERAAARERRAYESIAAAAQRTRAARAAAGGAVTSTLRRGAATAGIATTIGAGVAVRQTIEFDRQIRNVNSIAQLSERTLDRVGDRIELLGSKTAQVPVTIAEGMYDLVSSGFKAGESLTIVESSAKAATAGLTDTAISTKAVAAVLNAYRLDAKDAALVSDTLFQTVNVGVISFAELAQNIGDVLPFASSLGVALAELGAATATMTKAGISAPETMTRIKGVMTALIKPSEALADAISRAGYESGEALVRHKGFQGALDALVGVTDGSKAALARLFPDVRALGGALALTGKNSRGANDDLESFADVVGATDKALSQQSKSVSYEWDKMRATASGLAIDVGQELVPAMTDLLEVGTDLSKDLFKGLKDDAPQRPRPLPPGGNPLVVASPFAQRSIGPQQQPYTGVGITNDDVSNAEQLGEALREIVQNATPVVEALADASTNIAEFVGERPALAKTAGTLLGVAAAVKAIRFVGAVTGVSKLIELTGRLARTKGGQRAADAVIDGLSAIPSRGRSALSTVNAWLATKMAKAGLIAGEQAAISTASSMATQFPASVNARRGKFAAPFGRIGKLAGAAFAGAFLLAVPGLVESLSDAITSAFPFLERYSGSKGWGNLGSDLIGPFKGAYDSIRHMGPRGATGGIFTGSSFAPAFVSSGEVVEHNGREWTVPGPRVAADNVFAMLPLGARVFTEHGQAIRSAGYSDDEALAWQAPHFRTGGQFRQPYGALDAFQQGFDAGVNGTRRLFRTPTGMDSDLFRSAISGVRANRRDVPHRLRASGGRGGPGSWEPGMNTLAWGRAFARHHDLTISSTYRTAAQNRAANGVTGSKHTHGSPSNPGAIDFMPPRQAALAYAKSHGAREALIHDAGSGLHLHVGFFRNGGIARYRTGSNGGARPSAARSRMPDLERLRGAGAQTLRAVSRADTGAAADVVKRMRVLGALLDDTEQISYRRLSRLSSTIRDQIGDLARGGLDGRERVQVRRLRATLTLVDATMGKRLGEAVATSQRMLDVVAENQSLISSAMGRRGMDESSGKGLGIQAASDRNSLEALRPQRKELVTALHRARRAHQPEAAKAIEEQTKAVSDTMRGLAVSVAQKTREAARAKAQEAVNASQFGVDVGNANLQFLEASQRVAGTVDTAGGMRDRAAALSGQQPALQALIDSLNAQASVALKTHDLDGWRQATLAATQATTDLANVQAEAADLVRSAAMRIPQDALDTADFKVQMAQQGFAALELEQRLNGTYDTGAGGQARADFISTQIVPVIKAQIDAANALVEAARQQYGTESQEYRDALLRAAALSNELKQAMIDAKDATQANTDELKQLGGTLTFTRNGQLFTDNINAGVGA